MRRPEILMLLLALAPARGTAAESPEAPPLKVNCLKIVGSMLSDAQIWTDHGVRGDVRLQKRAGADQWRVLGKDNAVIARGTREACEAKWRREAAKILLAADKPIVVLVHGLFQTRAKMETIEDYLKQSGKLQVVNFGYASTRGDIESHAAALAEVLSDAPPQSEISFVGHSMGCIVIRKLLAERKENAPWTAKRFVMIGPPNQGAEMARRLSRVEAVRMLLGPGFDELAKSPEQGVGTIPTPSCDFAVIAGASPRWLLNNPLIAGDDDWIVGVDETTLEGAAFRLCVDAHHGSIVHHRETLDATLAFLLSGEAATKFEEE